MRLDGVEVKITMADDQVARALDTLELGDDSCRRIWFYEDMTPGLRPPLPLFESGVVIRVRSKPEGDGGDCTVKLRPCRRSQLTKRWLSVQSDGDLEFRIEADWAGDRRMLATSCQTDVNRKATSRVESQDTPPPGMLSREQSRFLVDCAPLRVNTAELSRLGPIDATRWKEIRANGFEEIGARAERWTVRGMDFLELSIKVDEEDAEEKSAEFALSLARCGLSPDPSQETKTRRVLQHLSG